MSPFRGILVFFHTVLLLAARDYYAARERSAVEGIMFYQSFSVF